MHHHMHALTCFHRRLAAEALSDLAGFASPWIPAPARNRLRRSGRRRRLYTPLRTFWNFLAQVLTPGQPCRAAVRQLQAARRRRGQKAISSATGGYCQARAKLPESILHDIWRTIAARMAAMAPPATLWCGCRVAIVDGTTLSMPDTAANQAVWPQSSQQHAGCGFPVMKLVGLFSLATGALCALATGTLHDAEHTLWARLWNACRAHFDLVVGDRNFGSFATFCALRVHGMHGVFRLHQARKLDWRTGQRLGSAHDRLFVWHRPPRFIWSLSVPAPASITIRVLRVCVPIRGFRTRVMLLSTTLLDARRFPADALADLYRRRWHAELFLRDIKTCLHMDVLRCLSPAMIRRELHMHLIAYNLIRALMLHAACLYHTDSARVSFAGACDALRQWLPHLACLAATPALCRALIRDLLAVIAHDRVPLRPNRSEPRAVKRRPKNYHLLTKPRHLMGNLPHRNRPLSGP